jgi:hypothetical protein
MNDSSPCVALHRVKLAAIRRFIFVAAAAAAIFAAGIQASVGAESKQVTPELATKEKGDCTKNLQTIYTAIEAYRRDHKNLPNWFSDLVPDYLPDANVLICPVCRRTGETDAAPLSDPRVASSYLFEFCPVPLGTAAPGNPKVTRREWKQRQMGIVGSVVPIVRCRHHHPTLNLAFDGRVYESPPSWETMLTNVVDPESLTPAKMFPANPGTARPAVSKKTYPDRESKAGVKLLDLTEFFNAGLTETWHGGENAIGNDLGALAPGVQNLGGVDYDVRGIVQLASKAPTANRYPTNVTGIQVNQKCEKLHFLHAAAFGHPPDEGKKIGVYILHFAASQMRMEVPIVYGADVRDWHYWSGEKDEASTLKVVWKGQNTTSTKAKSYVRLFETTWTNVASNIELQSIDFVSTMSQPAPFLLAVTLE